MRCVTVQKRELREGIEIGLTERGRLAVVLTADDTRHHLYALLDETHMPTITDVSGTSFIHDAEFQSRKIHGRFPVLRKPSPIEQRISQELLVRVNTHGKHRTGSHGTITVGGGAMVELAAQGHSGRRAAESRWTDALIKFPEWGYALIRMQGAVDEEDCFAIGNHEIHGLQMYTRNDYARILHEHVTHNPMENGMSILLTPEEMSDYWRTRWDEASAEPYPSPHAKRKETVDYHRKPSTEGEEDIPPYFPGFFERE